MKNCFKDWCQYMLYTMQGTLLQHKKCTQDSSRSDYNIFQNQTVYTEDRSGNTGLLPSANNK